MLILRNEGPSQGGHTQACDTGTSARGGLSADKAVTVFSESEVQATKLQPTAAASYTCTAAMVTVLAACWALRVGRGNCNKLRCFRSSIKTSKLASKVAQG